MLSNTRMDGFGLEKLLPYMPYLAELYIIVDEYGGNYFPLTAMSAQISVVALGHVSISLK